MKRLLYPALYIRMALYIGAALTAFILIGALAFASIAAWELTGYLETRNSEIGREAARAVKTGGLPGRPCRHRPQCPPGHRRLRRSARFYGARPRHRQTGHR